jgi:hypothetical protein
MTINSRQGLQLRFAEIKCGSARHDPNIKGAILIAEFSSGTGYLLAETPPKDDGRGPGRDRGLFIGGIEIEHNIVFFPAPPRLPESRSGPASFTARGLWCYADGLEGSIDSYSRVNGPKDLVVVRAPHAFETWPQTEQQRTVERMIAYARTVLAGDKTVPGRRTWSNMKELVATSGDVWEPSTHPTTYPRKESK